MRCDEWHFLVLVVVVMKTEVKCGAVWMVCVVLLSR